MEKAAEILAGLDLKAILYRKNFSIFCRHDLTGFAPGRLLLKLLLTVALFNEKNCFVFLLFFSWKKRLPNGNYLCRLNKK